MGYSGEESRHTVSDLLAGLDVALWLERLAIEDEVSPEDVAERLHELHIRQGQSEGELREELERTYDLLRQAILALAKERHENKQLVYREQLHEQKEEILVGANQVGGMEEFQSFLHRTLGNEFPAAPWGVQITDKKGRRIVAAYGEKADRRKNRRLLNQRKETFGDADVTYFYEGSLDGEKDARLLQMAPFFYDTAMRCREAYTDVRTNLWRPPYLLIQIENELKRAERHVEGHDLSLLFIDLDGFKQLNDDHGHEAGDKALLKVAKILGKHHRAEDVVCRYGGDEFVLLLPECDVLRATKTGERIRREIEEARFRDRDEKLTVQLSCSVGVVTRLPGSPIATAKDLLILADTVMYESKHGGKNMVTAVEV
jgi:diguanylate cyclase (GGDEF)-like protein